MKILTKQEVLNGIKYYFKSILDENGNKTGCGWSQCALGSLINHCGNKKDIEDILGYGPWEFWDKSSFYRQITDFNDKFIAGGLTFVEVNFFLSSLASKYNLNYKPIRVYKPVKLKLEYELHTGTI